MLIHQVARTVQRYGMIAPGERVLVAISGGPDSVAMTHVLYEIRQRRATFEMVLAHLNHRLRIDSDEDEAFCACLAEQLELPFASESVDVKSRARSARCSLEEAGRLARYDFLGRTAASRDCARIAVGHTRNDQAETLLMRMLRGAGTRGLAAMHPVSSGVLIRPLLEVKRESVLDFLASRAIPYRRDPTNEDCTITRNRLRHWALPFLEKEFNPSVVETLSRTANLLREEEEWMEAEASRTFRESAGTERLEGQDDGLRLSVERLAGMHRALARRVIRQAIQAVKGDLRSVTSRHVEDVLDLIAPGKSGRRLSLPGLEATRSFDGLLFRQGNPRFQSRPAAHPGYNRIEYVLPVPGRVEIPESGGAIEAESSSVTALPATAGDAVVIGLPDEETTSVDLRVRYPRRGDRFHPLGAPGTKSLSRYLMAHRVERGRRWKVPLVIHGDNEILWVVGHGVSETSRVGPRGRSKVHLSWVER